jgi:MFS family permease
MGAGPTFRKLSNAAMPTLEQVCKRLFSTPSWLSRCLIGALLLAVPVAHFFAFGYFYEMVARARRGDSMDFPEWDDWRRMFVNGVPAFLIFMVLAVFPLVAAWFLTWPLRTLGYGVFVYLPMVPVVMMAAPLTAAGIYQYQKREEYRDAFRVWLLVRMMRASKARFFVPTFALVGFMMVGYPLMTFTLFLTLAAGWSYYATFFRAVEESRQGPRRPSGL